MQNFAVRVRIYLSSPQWRSHKACYLSSNIKYMAIFMFQQDQQCKVDHDSFDGKQISNRLLLYGGTFIALSLKVFALQKNKLFCGLRCAL